MRRLGAFLLLLATAAMLAACGGDSGGSSTSGTGASSGASSKLTVFAAASLTDPFTTIGKQFEAANPGVKVTFNFAGSNTLVTQISQGAPADVFASADTQNMGKLVSQSLVDTPTPFIKNTLTVAIPAANPGKIENLKDLANDGVKIAAGAEDVPIGTYTSQVLAKMGESSTYGPDYEKAVKANIVSQETSVSVTPVTKETDVKAALTKVKLGEVDAALVYRTDARSAAADVDGIEFPESASAINDYPIVVLKNAANKAGAEAFVAWVRSAKGQAVLAGVGFQAP